MPAPGDLPRLRIILTSIEYPPDPLSSGIGSYTRTLSRLLTARGHKIHVVARGIEGDTVNEEEGVSVHRLTPTRPELPEHLGIREILTLIQRDLVGEWCYRRKTAERIDKLITTEGIDLIEAAEHLAEPILYRPARHPMIPLVVRLHTPLSYSETVVPNIPEIARRVVAAAERNFLSRATHLSAPSQAAAEIFLRKFGLMNRQVEVYPNPPTYPPEEVGASPVEEDPNLVLFVGRITKWKGAHLLIRAIPNVVARRPEARFVFIGNDNLAVPGFHSMTEYLYSLLPSELHQRVTFTGHLAHQQVKDYYRRATVCVFPSLFEAFGYTCLEAMTFGKAIIGSKRGGMVELLDGGRAGLLSAPEVEELSHQLLRFWMTPNYVGNSVRALVGGCSSTTARRESSMVSRISTTGPYGNSVRARAGRQHGNPKA